MPQSFLGLMLSFLALALCGMSFADNGTYQNSTGALWLQKGPLCYYTANHKYPNKVDFQNTIGPWLNETLQDWRADNPGWKEQEENHLGFYEYLVEKYAPSATKSITDCDLQHGCAIPDCDSFDQTIPLQELVNAYYSLMSMFNIYKTHLTTIEANKEAFDGIKPAYMLPKYTDTANWAEHVAKTDMALKLSMQIFSGVMLIAGPWGTPFLAADAALTIGAKVAEVSAEAAAHAAKMAANMARVFSSFASTASLTNSLTGIELAVKAKDPAAAKDELAGKLEDAMHTHYNLTTFVIRHSIHGLMNGGEAIDGKTIVDVVAGGEWAESSQMHSTEFQNQMRNTWFATYLGIIWRLERTYIVMADAESSCAADDRGPQHLKICLNDYPRNVFYIYFIPKVREGTPGTALVRGPPGHLNIANEQGIHLTLDDVVESSVFAYTHKMKDSSGSQDDATSYDQYFEEPGKGGRYRGLFSIPICRNPDGGAISSINHQKSKNYPCMCGENPWNDKDNWDYSRDETQQFLIDTGLVASGDWQKHCDHHCKKDHKTDFDFGDVKTTDHMHHPFDKCKTEGHKVKGVENDESDGSHEQEKTGETVGTSRREGDGDDDEERAP